MVFEYIKYYRGCLIIPLIGTLLGAIALIGSVIRYVMYAFRNHIWFPKDKTLVCSLIFGLLIGGFFLYLDGGRLVNGGVFLVSEKETDAVLASGTIESIELMGINQFGELKSEYNVDELNGVCFTIDGMDYKAIAKGDLKIGDTVEFLFLPKSKYILEIYTRAEESFARQGKTENRPLSCHLITV